MTFRRYDPDLDLKEKRDILSVSLNSEERSILNELKELLNIKDDSTAMKEALFIGKNVIQTLKIGVYPSKIFNRPYTKKRHQDHKNIKELLKSNTKTNEN